MPRFTRNSRRGPLRPAWARAQAWLLAWGGFLAIFAVSRGGSWGLGAGALAGTTVIAIAVGLVGVVPRRLLRVGITALLGFVVAAGLAQLWQYTTGLAGGGDRVSTVGVTVRGPIEQLTGIVHGERRWSGPADAGPVQVHMLARAVPAEGDLWQGTSGRARVRSGAASAAGVMVDVPPGDRGTVTRVVIVGPKAAAADRFRVSIHLRLRGSASLGRPVVNVSQLGGASRVTAPVAPGASWQWVRIDWAPPVSGRRDAVALSLTGLAGNGTVIGRTMLEAWINGRWQVIDLSPRVLVRLEALDGSGAIMRDYEATFTPTAKWTPYEVALNSASGGSLRLIATVGSGAVVRFKGLRAIAMNTHLPLRSLPRSRRIVLAGLPPNLLGHTLVALYLVVLALAGGWRTTLVATLLTLTGIALSGSRAAMLGAATGTLLFLRPSDLRRRRRWVPIALGLLSLTIVFAVLEQRPSGTDVTRPEIWATAARAFVSHPLHGLAVPFGTFWSQSHPDEVPVTHAHDLWLQFAAAYGLGGLLAVAWLTVALGRLAWLWGGWRGVSLVVPILIMNVFDYTLFFSGVLYPLILGLNALGTPRSERKDV